MSGGVSRSQCRTTTSRGGEVNARYAHPGSRNSGAGRALIEVALADLRGAGCQRAVPHVQDANGRARRFYERAGFAVEATGLPLEEFPFALTQARYGRSL
jgi:ribosomal protein S18 acetylase RimI-like enzyme